ncbi:MAG: transglycosylase domain-containing protein [Eubacterium sp.]
MSKIKRPSVPPKKEISKGKKIGFIVLISIAICIIGSTIAFAVMYAQVPPLDANNFNYIENAKILDVHGNFYQDLQSSEQREVVSIDQMPEILKNAFISIEDQRFRTHKGIDLKRLGRALLSATTSGSLDGPGGSTITQQLIKLTHLTSDKTIVRKFQELILASRLETIYSKDQILEAYLNKINLSQAWGVQAASKIYFAKSVNDLSLSQSAVLASIANSPSYYDPYTYTENEKGEFIILIDPDGSYPLNEHNRSRSLLVIEKMNELGYINQAEYDQSKSELETNQIGLTHFEPNYNYSYFTDSVYDQIVKDLIAQYHYTEEEASNYLLNGSLIVHATVDPNVQAIMETKASDDNLYPGQSGSAASASAAKTADTGEVTNYIPQVGMTIIDNKTGYVSGIVGGRDEKTNLSLNRATRKFQPGSSTKPLTAYGPGIDTGAITLGTVYADVPISYNGWNPQNSGGGFSGLTTIRQGLTDSINTIAVQANVATGLDTAASYGENLGLDIVKTGDNSMNDMTPAALALGGYTHGQSSLAMASAFSSFPNGGVRTTPTFYTKVVDATGKTILENKPKTTAVFKPQTAYLITDVLQAAVNGGTTNIAINGQPVAGKTGTTDEERHAWFCGYTPYYSMAVWYGYDDNVVETNEGTYYLNIGVFGGSKPGPAYMFEQVMNAVHEGLPPSAFPENPGGISKASIDKVSGKLATNLTAKDPRGSMAFSEMFIDGTAPTAKDDAHVEVELDVSTNSYKTPYCPPSLVQKVVRIKKPADRFPSGIIPLDPNYSTSAEAELFLPPEDQICPIHTSPVNVDINLSVGGGGVGGTLTMKAGKSIVMTANGPSNGATTFTASNDTVTLSPNGNQVTITAVKPGQSQITITQTVTTTIGQRTYESIYTKPIVIQVE